MSSEIQEKYLGFLVTGFAVGDERPYRCAARVQIPVDNGWAEPEWDQPIEPGGQYETEKEAAIAGVLEAKLWISSHPEIRPKQDG
jgi:hypothetical protein